MASSTNLTSNHYSHYLPYVSWALDLVTYNLVYYLIVGLWWNAPILSNATSWIMFNLVAVIVVGRTTNNTIHSRTTSSERVFNRIVSEVLLHAFIFVAVLYILGRTDVSWQALMLFYVALFWGLLLERFALRRFVHKMRSMGRNMATVVIVGHGYATERLFKMLHDTGELGYRIAGVFSAVVPDESSRIRKYYRGEVSMLEEFLAENHVDEIFYSSESPEADEITRVARMAELRMQRFFFVPQIPRQLQGKFYAVPMGPIPIMSLQDTPLKSRVNRFVKRAFDLTVSSVVLLLSPVVYIPVAIAIKMSSPGPVFFKQKRTGLYGKEFYCYKFRTMKVNVDADKLQATKDDPRKTRVGEFLRHSSIDELPQFLNVFRGEMSIVGPRPHMLKHTEEYSQLINTYMVRHAVKPGITGWAQVTGYRGQTEELWQMEGRVERDIWYIEHWSFALDLKIMAFTVINAIKGEDQAF